MAADDLAVATLLRLRYSKTGRAKYISHLDLMETMRRAMLRAGMALKYSEGFNPHPYMSVALPLPVGCESLCELLDVRVSGLIPAAGIPQRITDALPEGLEVTEAYTADRKFNGITWVAYDYTVYYDSELKPETTEKLKELFSSECIIVPKKTKSGVSDIDITPYIKNVRVGGGDNGGGNGGGESGGVRTLTIKAEVSAQNPSVSPSMLTSAIQQARGATDPDFYMFTRTEIYDINMNMFR